MSKAETMTTRLPRGTRPVSQAFLTALDAVPDASRAAVAKAAQAMIRDELKARREKTKVIAANEKARVPASKSPASKATSKVNGAPSKRRSRKPADISAVA